MEERRENDSFAFKKYKQLRDENNLTDYRVANGSGISTAVISQWSKGEYNLKLEKIIMIANFFKVPFTDFIESTESNETVESNNTEETIVGDDYERDKKGE